MGHAYSQLAFTAAVQAAQQRDGSAAAYARRMAAAGPTSGERLGAEGLAFIAQRRSLYLATVSETGWPYVQHRGGPRGFVKALDDRTLAFADFAGNRQFISLGNAAGNDKVSLILVDYGQRTRLKLLGHLSQRPLNEDDPLWPVLVEAGYAARPQRVVKIAVAAFDWNCPQHLPLLLEAEHVQAELARRDARIQTLELELERRKRA